MEQIRAFLKGNREVRFKAQEREQAYEFIGGKVRNMHKAGNKNCRSLDRKEANKAIVLRMLERKARMRAEVVGDPKKQSIEPHAVDNIATGAEIHTGEFSKCWCTALSSSTTS